MKVLYTIKEYAKQRCLSEQAIRKQVASKLCESTIIDKISYIIEDDLSVKKLKQNIKNKNSKNNYSRLNFVSKG